MGELFSKKNFVLLLVSIVLVVSIFSIVGFVEKNANKNVDNSFTGFAVHPQYSSFSEKSSGFNFDNSSRLLSVSDTIVYKTGYYSINGSAWQIFTLNGEAYNSNSNWLRGYGSKSLPTFGAGEHYIIIYSCSYSSGVWDCHDGKWQLIVINNAVVSSTCDNDVKDGDETGVDCGGSCGVCASQNYLRAFYVSNTGSDSNDGLSASTPWKTIAKVNSYTSFKPGDAILFKRGDTWREELNVPSSGNANYPITFGAYGSGNKPRIYGSTKIAWTQYSGNIWKSSSTVSNPYSISDKFGGVFFEDAEGEVSWGWSNAITSKTYSMPAITDLSKEYEWTWVSNYIYIYSPTDPNTRYGSVEASQRDLCIDLNNKNYLVFDNLDLRYSKLGGIKDLWPFKGDLVGLEVANCHISHIGIKGSNNGFGVQVYHNDTWVHNNVIHDCGRRAITVRTQDADYYVINYLDYANEKVYRDTEGPIVLANILFEENVCYNGYHALVSIVSEEVAAIVRNATIRNNFLYDSSFMNVTAPEGYSSGALAFGGTGNITYDCFDDAVAYNNIIIAPTGYGLNLATVDHVSFYNNLVYGLNKNTGNNVAGTFYASSKSPDVVRDCNVKNNIFYNDYPSSTYSLRSSNRWEVGTVYYNIDMDHNLYYQTDSNQLFAYVYGKGPFSLSELSDYISETGWDANSVFSEDPLFTDPANWDFTLQAGSPAIGAGENVGLTTDYAGNEYKSTPSIGPFEYGSTNTCTKTCSSLGYECGYQTVCGVSTNCGTCSTDYNCVSGTCIVNSNQSSCSDTCSSLGYACGTHSVCGVSTNCGTCGTGYNCSSSGVCIENVISSGEDIGLAYYKFEQNADDTLGNYAGTEVTAITYENDGFPTEIDGYMANFDSNYISLPQINYGNQFTISLWFFSSNTGGSVVLFSALQSNNGFEIKLNLSNGVISVVTGNGASTTTATSTSGTFSRNTWQHIAVVFDKTSGTCKIYNNNADVTSSSAIRTDFKTDTAGRLGISISGSGTLWGRLDDVQIYNVGLTSSEVSSVYNVPGTMLTR